MNNIFTRIIRPLLVGIVVIWSGLLVLGDLPDSKIGAVDFIQYWSSAGILLDGANPYDRELQSVLQTSVWDREETGLPVIMYNPPLVFLFIIPFAVFSFGTAAWLWFAGIISGIIAATLLLYRQYKREEQSVLRLALLLIVIVSFPPFLTLLFYGQISHLLLLGLTGYVLFSVNQAPFKAGLSLAVTLIKPHALYLLYFWVLLEGLRNRNAKTIIGFVVGTVLLGIIPLAFQTEIWKMYFQFASDPPVSWITPTVGSWLQGWFITDHQSSGALAVRLLPSAVTAVVFFIWYTISSGADKKPLSEKLAVIIPLSLVTAPYGWVYDQVLIYPLLVYVLIALPIDVSIRAAKWIILCNVIAACIPSTLGQQYAIWYPPALAAVLVAASQSVIYQKKVESPAVL